MNPTISFQSRVLFLASGFHKKESRGKQTNKQQKKNPHLNLSARVQWDGSFHSMFIHPRLGGSNLIIFKIKLLNHQDASENCILLLFQSVFLKK